MTFIRSSTAAVASIVYGGYLIWKGITGDIWRTRFTGDAVIPRWLYIAGGLALVLLGLAWMIAAACLARR